MDGRGDCLIVKTKIRLYTSIRCAPRQESETHKYLSNLHTKRFECRQTDRQIHMPTQLTNQPTDYKNESANFGMKPTEQPLNLNTNDRRTNEQASQPTSKPAINHKTVEQVNEPTSELWNEPTNEPTNKETNERASVRTLERTNERTRERTLERTIATNQRNQPANQPANQPTSQPTNGLWIERTNARTLDFGTNHSERMKKVKRLTKQTNEQTNKRTNDDQQRKKERYEATTTTTNDKRRPPNKSQHTSYLSEPPVLIVLCTTVFGFDELASTHTQFSIPFSYLFILFICVRRCVKILIHCIWACNIIA